MIDRTPKQHDSVAFRVLAGSAALVCPEDSLLYWLNPVATRIWELCDGEHTIEAIAEQLTAEFDVEHQTALQDTEHMVREFEGKQLLVVS